MSKINIRWGWFIGIAAICGSSIGSTNCAVAQIIPDSTLPNNSNVTKNGNIFNITEGTQAGSNLFHSFQEFSVPTGGTAIFNNAADIQNIISRVTGGSRSDIDGIIRTNPTANLFLINPNGIVFGQNAQLNVGGSFVATTANALQFGNRGFFSATEKNIPSPLLTINPSALLFNQINQNAAIQNNSIAFAGKDPAGFDAFGLRVPNGKSLLLVGGNVSMDGGKLNAYGGRVELGGVAEPSSVALGVDGDNLSLKFPDNVARTDVSLTNNSSVFVTGAGGGNIAINARNLEILGGTVLTAGIKQGLGTPETIAGEPARRGDAGNVNVNVTEKVDIAGEKNGIFSGIFSTVETGTVGNGGNITIDSGSFSLHDGAFLTALTDGQGKAGNVTVRAKNAVELREAAIFSTVESGGMGKGGNIDINAATLSLTDGAQLQTLIRRASATQPAGQGDAGNVNINVTGAVNITGQKKDIVSGIFSTVETGAVGNGGNITIDSGSLSLGDGAFLTALTSGQGKAGDVTVRVKNAVDLAHAFIFSTVDVGGVGKGGNIDINAATLSLTDGAQLQTLIRRASATQPAGQGDAGNVNVNVTGKVDIAGEKNGIFSGIFSTVETGTVGNGGNITIDSGSFSLHDGAFLTALTDGQGKAGNVTVRAKNAVELREAAIFNTVESGGMGKGGNIDINAATLSLTDGAQLQTLIRRASATQPAEQGDAGNVNVNVTGKVDIAGEKKGIVSGIFSTVETGTVGNGGNITIDSGSFSLHDGAFLTALTSGQGKAGDVTVRAKNAVELREAAIFSTVESGGVGKGGNIDINAGTLSLIDGAQVATSALGVGDAGTIVLDADVIALDSFKSGVFSTLGSTTAPIIKVNKNDFGFPTVTIEPRKQPMNPNAQGNSGNINITFGSFSIINGAPPVTIEPRKQTINPNAQGNSGNTNITSGLFSITNGARLSASTFGRGNAGSININTQNAVFSGTNINGLSSGVFSAVEKEAVGNAGTIKITTNELTLKGGAQLVASSFGEGNAGTVTIEATDKFLVNGANSNGSPTGVFAESRTGRGGDIVLKIKNLLMLRHQGLISATSGVAGSNGVDGNINIGTKFLVAVPSENSDIIATGFGRSPGSNIQVNAQGIFGTQFRQQLSPESDIVATGQVTLNTPDVEPKSGLVNLPTVPIDTEVAQTCQAGGTFAKSSFTITGRGGLPPNPTTDILTPDLVHVDLVSLNPNSDNPDRSFVPSKTTTPAPEPIIEATGLALNQKGEVVLTANHPTTTPHSPWLKPASCKAIRNS